MLSALYNGELRPALAPAADVGQHIPYKRTSFGAEALEQKGAGADKSFAAILSLKEYPSQAQPGMTDALLRLPYEMTLSESFAFVDRQIGGERVDLALRRFRAADDDAQSLRRGLVEAKDDLSSGRSAMGEHNLTPPGAGFAVVDGAGPGRGGLRLCAGRHRRCRRPRDSRPGAGVLGAVSGQRDLQRASRPDFQRRLRRVRQLARLPDRNGGRQPLGPGRHGVRDHLGDALLLQLPPRRPWQLHHHRAVGVGQDGGAELSGGAGGAVRPPHSVL